MEKCCHNSTFIYDLLFFILVGNKDVHNSLDGFEFLSQITEIVNIVFLNILYE